ncbi:GGDEF domain-containing protein [Mesoaciditoga lauensis]|uniref:GGDEF domain-containing protein n=1 Tax=Mesoaciditoga lauensis TaxID=1495039 RepID=UPI00055CF720|nr:diguanylate cyclase [Mesoaciditoga lauensis]
MENDYHLKTPSRMDHLINFISALDPFEKSLEDFLSALLRELMFIIPEADCGSAFIYEDGKVKFVDAVCHDLEALKKLDLDEKDFILPKNEVLLVKNTLDLHSDETKKKFAGAIRPLKESLVFDLKINGKNVAGMGIDILKGKEKHFSERSMFIAKLFKNLAANAFRIKVLEEELNKSNIKFKTLSDFSPVGIVLINSDLKFSYVNKAACEISGYTKNELLNMYFWELIHPDFSEMVKERGLKRLHGAEAIKEYAVKIITKDGGEKWVDLRSKKVDLFGEPMLVVSALDVDELKITQQRMKSVMRRYELALEASQLSVFEYDVKRKRIKISKEIFNQLGYDWDVFDDSLEEFRKLTHSDGFKRIVDFFEKCAKDEKSKFDVEYRMLSNDGEWQWIYARGKLVKAEEENLIMIFGVMSNVNERKKMEERLKEYATYDELTGVYNRRTGLTILSEKMKSSQRSGEPLSICFVDINDLKHVNDKFGHAEGDKLIKTSVKIMLKNIRKSDVLCRMGGDEFLLIFPSCRIENAEKRWEKVKADLERENNSETHPYAIILSHGCAQYDYKRSQDEFVAQADVKMYEEKKRMKSQRFNLFS